MKKIKEGKYKMIKSNKLIDYLNFEDFKQCEQDYDNYILELNELLKQCELELLEVIE